MKVLKDISGEIADTNSNHWNFELYEQNDGIALAVGINWVKKNNKFKDMQGVSKAILFNNWAPCEYAQRDLKNGVDAIHMENEFDFVLTICPYSAMWRNMNSLFPKYIYAFYPYSSHLIPDMHQKKYDVIYHGGIHGKEHITAMKVIMNYKYRYTSLDYGINPLTRKYLRYATDINLSFGKKIQRIAETKISLCFNLIHVSHKHYKNMMKYKSILPINNDLFDSLNPLGIFKNYPWIGVLPQFKTRIHEAAISRCINLVFNDGWNVIEDYYEPDKEFLYFFDEKDLKEKISFILNKWDSEEIQSIIEAAFQKSMRYSSENFMKKYSQIVASDSPINEITFNKKEFWL
jgi:hypothetical protein